MDNEGLTDDESTVYSSAHRTPMVSVANAETREEEFSGQQLFFLEDNPFEETTSPKKMEVLPFGSLVPKNGNKNEQIKIPATEKVMEMIKKLMTEAEEAVKQKSIQKLRDIMRSKLSIHQFELVFVELVRDEDLHEVLKQIDARMFDKTGVKFKMREAIHHAIAAKDSDAIIARALLGTGGAAVTGGVIGGVHALRCFHVGIEGVSNAVMFFLFSAVEIGRWAASEGKMTTETLFVNIGEHFAGSSMGLLGGWGGAVAGGLAGAALGSAIPIIGTLVGGIVGTILGLLIISTAADTTSRTCYRIVLPRNEGRPDAVIQRAQIELGVSVEHHTYEEARTRFRNKILSNHAHAISEKDPKKLQQLAVDSCEKIACWCIVREYYAAQNGIEDQTDAYIEVSVLKVKCAKSGEWELKESWCGAGRQREVADISCERIETVTIPI